jgi:hypothetical protein
MKKKTLFILLILLLFGLSFGIINLAHAAGPSFSLTRSVVGAGGLGGSTEAFTIASTLGQPVAVSPMGGEYPLSSGFWAQVIETIEESFSFLPQILH